MSDDDKKAVVGYLANYGGMLDNDIHRMSSKYSETDGVVVSLKEERDKVNKLWFKLHKEVYG